MIIRPLYQKDYTRVRTIYQAGLDTGIASFETNSLSWPDWDKKYLPFCRLVAEIDGRVAGWIALTPFSSRSAYRGVAEISLYVDPGYKDKGIGTKLMEELIEQARSRGIWTLQAAIFPENRASVHLHQKLGFRIVGIREKIGRRNGRWYDNVLLEKRFKPIE